MKKNTPRKPRSKKKRPKLPPKPAFNLPDAMQALMQATSRGTPTTPQRPLNQQVELLIARLAPGVQPVTLPFTNVDPSYPAGFCHGNVVMHVQKHGGERVNGWMVWTNGTFAEGEAHSVWRDPSGNLVDVTPRADGELEILFLPDPNADLIYLGGGDYKNPCNRTTIKGCPYTKFGIPRDTRHVVEKMDAAGVKLMGWVEPPP